MTLTQKSELRRALIKISVPYIMESLVETLMFYVDAIMLGHIPDPHKATEAIAAVGVAGPIYYSTISILGGLGAATIALVARAFGEQDTEKLTRNAGAAILVALMIGSAGSLAGAFLLPMLARTFQVPGNPHAVELAASYVAITSIGIMPFMLEISCAAIMRACGNMVTPLIIGVMANILNFVGNYLLIYGKLGFPEMGVRGSACATLLAQTVYGVASFLVVLLFGVKGIRIPLARILSPGKEVLGRLARISLPATIEPIILQAGFLLYSYLVALLGQSQLAAHRIAIAIESLTFMPGNAIAVACSALVGQSLGMKSVERARLAFHESGRFALYFMTTVGAMFLIYPRIFVSLFFKGDPDVFHTACLLIAISAFEQPFFSLAMVYAGGLRGAGDTRSPVLIGFIGIWLVRIPITYLLAHRFGLGAVGVWLTMIIDWAIRLSVAYAIFRKGRWAQIKL